MTYADVLAPLLLRVPQADQEQLPTFQELRRAITHITNAGDASQDGILPGSPTGALQQGAALERTKLQNVLTKFMESRQLLSLYERASPTGQGKTAIAPSSPSRQRLHGGTLNRAAETQRRAVLLRRSTQGGSPGTSARTECLSLVQYYYSR